MSKLIFFFKIKNNKSKKSLKYNNVGSIMLLYFLLNASNIKQNKIFLNKFIMLRSPFHYKVSKIPLYNKQSIISFEKKIESYINYNILNIYNLPSPIKYNLLKIYLINNK